MAAASALTDMSLNGTDISTADSKSLQQFYHSLFQLQDDVFAGNHPRIKLPDHVMFMIAKVKQGATISTANNLNDIFGGKQGAPISAGTGALLPGLGLSSVGPPAANSQRPVPIGSKPPSSSAFDPILLTKSDELVSAEISIKRQRIEQMLADQATASKPFVNSRARDFAPDYETSLNVDEVYQSAMRVIPHQSAWPEREQSESFDENDYYSSQAMSWSTEHTDADGAETTKFGQQLPNTQAPAPSHFPQPAAIQYQEKAAQQVPLPAEYDELPDEDDEDDYSPPPPDAMAGATDSDSTPNQQVLAQANASRPTQPYDSRYEYNRPHQPPANPSAVIHSHIREPYMPQPARVSPLALGKVPSLEQTQIPPISAITTHNAPRQPAEISGSEQANYGTPRERSPVAPKETMKVSKKRKRKEERAAAREEKRSKRDAAKQSQRERQAGSPEQYIKPEPTSPPAFASFADVPPPPRRRVIDHSNDDVQVVSPYEPRTRPYREYAEYPPPPPGYRYAEPVSPQQMRPYSPGPSRRVERDNQDLRRVASLHYARRPYSPAAAYPPHERPPSVVVSQPRAASYAYYDREPIYRQASVAPPHYIRERSRSPGYDDRPAAYRAGRPLERVEPIERLASPAVMPPPPVPTRIVEDSYGNRYFATPAPPDAIPEMRVRESVPPPSRYYDDYPPAPPRPAYERPSTRASMMPPPQHAVYEDNMQPPPMMPAPQHRRVDEDQGGDVYRSYRQREGSMRPPESRGRAGMREDMLPPPIPRERPQMREAPEGRRIVSYDDSFPSPRQGPPVAKEHGYATMPRAYSVRPDAGRPESRADEMALSRGRDIPRYGTAQPQHLQQEHIVQMPWERGGSHAHAGPGGHNPFGGQGGMPHMQFPPAATREGRWVEVDEGHGGGRRVLPNGEVDEGYGGGKRVIYHM